MVYKYLTPIKPRINSFCRFRKLSRILKFTVFCFLLVTLYNCSQHMPETKLVKDDGSSLASPDMSRARSLESSTTLPPTSAVRKTIRLVDDNMSLVVGVSDPKPLPDAPVLETMHPMLNNKRIETSAGVRVLYPNKSAVPITEQKNCNPQSHPFFPLCDEKVQYLRHFWSTDKCFKETHKVNGTQCSFYNYLTQIEPFCVGEKILYEKADAINALPRFDITGLLKLLPLHQYKWMRERAKLMWESWTQGATTFMGTQRSYKKKKVFVYMASVAGNNLLERAWKGGPLGELIQWTDLISALYILGHDLTVGLKFSESSNILIGKDEKKCATGNHGDKVEIIYTDLWGIALLRRNLGESSFSKYRCMCRVLDSFGTYPEFNDPHYPYKIPGEKSSLGVNYLLLTQYLTLYPHTHDNSFLGFVVNSNKSNNRLAKMGAKDKALLYSKSSAYFNLLKNYEHYIQIVSDYFEIHATMEGTVPLSVNKYIQNHGSVSGEQVQQLLSESKLFLGLGFPFEGPGPLEAMANGVVYLQPKFQTPVNKLNHWFFVNKPTLRELTSQNPYMENFVGKPYCYTIDVTDEAILRKTLEKIKAMKTLPNKIPKEFTTQGMLERVFAYTRHMDYCNPYAPRWPPLSNLQVFFSLLGQSCKYTCMSKGLVCERTYFDEINTVLYIEEKGKVKCANVRRVRFLHAPSFDALLNTCYIQVRSLTFSCMHHEKGMKRLCPCRNYESEQSAICKNCL